MDRSSRSARLVSMPAPESWKLVRTMGGAYVSSTIRSGKKAVAPWKPPKNISPEGLWKQAHQPVRSCPGRPSATEYCLKISVLGLNLATPRLVLIQRSSWRSFRMQLMALLGRPSLVKYAVVALVRGLRRYRPFCVPDQMASGPAMSRLLVLSLP